MFMEVNKVINNRISLQESEKEFRDEINGMETDFILDEFVDFLRNGEYRNMYNYFSEDTQSDADLSTDLENEVWSNDIDRWDVDSDIDDDDLTFLQEPRDYNDKYKSSYEADSLPNNLLTKETMYNDTQRTPVDINDFSSEAAEFYLEDEEAPQNGPDDDGETIDEDYFLEDDDLDTDDTESEDYFLEDDDLDTDDTKSEDYFLEDDDMDTDDTESEDYFLEDDDPDLDECGDCDTDDTESEDYFLEDDDMDTDDTESEDYFLEDDDPDLDECGDCDDTESEDYFLEDDDMDTDDTESEDYFGMDF